MKLFKLIFLLSTLLIFTNSCKKDTPMGDVSGVVVDKITSEPIRGANVSLSPEGGSKVTGTDGKFIFTELTVQTYSITIAAEGYQTFAKNDVAVGAGLSTVVDCNIEPVQPVLAVSSLNIDFGDNLSQLPLEITNSGKGSLVWSVTENLAWLSVNPISGSTTTQKSSIVVTIDRTGLSQGTYSQSFSITSNGGNKTITINVNVPNPFCPTVTTSSVINISQTTAEVSGNVTVMGSSNVTEHGHCYSTLPNPTTASSKTSLGAQTTTGPFTSSLSGLQANTTYYVRAYATNSNGTGYSTGTSFTTSATPTIASVTTQTANNIAEYSATIQGAIASLGNSNIVQHGHCWSTVPNPTTANDKTTLGAISTTGSFNSSLSNLAANTTYYVRAYVTNGAGTAYSDEVFFATTALPQAPTVTTDAVSNITYNSVTLSGSIDNIGGVNVLEYGFCYGTSHSPTTANTKLIVGTSKTTTGSFSGNSTALAQSTTYYVRAYAINSVGTAYGSEQTINTTTDPYTVSNGLLAFYNFDNQNILDPISNNNGIGNNVTYSSSSPNGTGYSAYLDGTTSFINIPTTSFFYGKSSFTLNLWIKKNYSGKAECLFTNNNEYLEYGFYIATSGKLNLNGFSGVYSIDLTNSLLNNAWDMLTITGSNSSISYYINGVLYESKSCNIDWSYANAGTCKIGQTITYNQYNFKGNMDNIRFYNRALGAAEVTQLYNAKQ